MLHLSGNYVGGGIGNDSVLSEALMPLECVIYMLIVILLGLLLLVLCCFLTRSHRKRRERRELINRVTQPRFIMDSGGFNTR